MVNNTLFRLTVNAATGFAVASVDTQYVVYVRHILYNICGFAVDICLFGVYEKMKHFFILIQDQTFFDLADGLGADTARASTKAGEVGL
jgi:hypothetical protein